MKPEEHVILDQRVRKASELQGRIDRLTEEYQRVREAQLFLVKISRQEGPTVGYSSYKLPQCDWTLEGFPHEIANEIHSLVVNRVLEVLGQRIADLRKEYEEI